MSMNFSYGVIAAVGVLVAISIGFIIMSPDDVIGDRMDIVEIPKDDQSQIMPVEVILPIVVIPVGTSLPGCETDDTCYLPSELTVSSGSTVMWNIEDTAAHTVTSGSPASGISGMFDSGLVMAGSQFEYTFEDEGTFEYFCIVHPWMIGTVIVTS